MSIVKEEFFKKMGKKVVRAVGIAVCVLLFVLCVAMVIMSSVLSSAQIVDIFGYNLYLCGKSDFDGVPDNCAVIVEKCQPYDIDSGNLILYAVQPPSEQTGATAEAQQLIPSLAYAEQVIHNDGVYSLDVSDSAGNVTNIPGEALVGRASWSSTVMGRLIRFSLSPWGVFVMAALPCLALILFSFVKAAMDNRPIPEVLPQKKNGESDSEKPAAALEVKSDGNAEYSRSSGAKPGASADSVLYTYAKPKSPATMKQTAPTAAKQPTVQPKPGQPKTAPQPKTAAGGVPSSVAAKRYIDSATAAQKKPTPEPVPEEKAKKLEKILGGDTAELPALGKKKKSDAFFAQSSAPQIGRDSARSATRRQVIDLEDALAAANSRETKKHREQSARKSADILAAKSRSELITDDDDNRDRSRYDVDDILAGIDRKR